MNKSINIKVGIYDSQATITRHRNGSVTIRKPFIKWVNNTGWLSFDKLHIPAGDDAIHAVEIFDRCGEEVKLDGENQYIMGYGEWIMLMDYKYN